MDTLYFLAMMAGIAWLALWAAQPEGSRLPSPFAMRETATKAEAPAAAPQRRRRAR